MSSEESGTSTSSRIRQFGLYRTIDAKTEEFLRLSKKRQIRQGCACAAVSAAITVTVVVSVLLIYENSTNSESTNIGQKKTVNWLNLINDSSASPFEDQFAKKFIFDRTTLKLLPILLKALSQNRFLDKIIEDHTKQSPNNEKGDTTEISYRKNVFSMPKKFVPFPKSRLYTTEYKISPMVFYNKPTTNFDYYTKVRKIRNNKLLSYIDEILNKKLDIYSIKPMTKREHEITKKPLLKASTIRMKKYYNSNIHKYGNEAAINSIEKTLNKEESEKPGCKCPKQLGKLLTKLLSSFQQLIPNIRGILGTFTPCNNRSYIEPSELEIVTNKNTVTMSSTPTLTKVIKITKPKTNIKVNNTKSNNSSRERVQTTLETQTRKIMIINTMKTKPIENTLQITNIRKELPTSTQHFKAYIDATEPYNSAKHALTKPMTIVKDDVINRRINIKDYLLQKMLTVSNYTTKKSIPIFYEEDYNYDYITSTTSANLDFDMLDIHSFELVKSKITSSAKNNRHRKQMKPKPLLKQKPVTNYSNLVRSKIKSLFTTEKNEDTNYSNLVRSKLNILFTTEKNEDLITSTSKVDEYSSSCSSSSQATTTTIKPKIHNVAITKTKIQNSLKRIKAKKSNTNVHTEQETYRLNRTIIDDEFDKMQLNKPFEEFEDEEEVKRAGEYLEIDSINHKTTTNIPKSWISYSTDDFEKPPTSMIPNNRLSYLEIHRNELRFNERQNYDINFNQNLFE